MKTAERKFSTKNKILELIKQKDHVTVNQLTEALNVTSMAIRGHLTRLEEEGQIQFSLQRIKRGRPQQIFSLTQKGESLFPKSYDHFATELLDDLQELDDGKTLQKLFKIRKDKEFQRLHKALENTEGFEKLQLYCQFLSELGYMPKIQKMGDSSYQLIQNNCAILNIAQNHFCCCEDELSLLQALFQEAKVLRMQNRILGEVRCSYQVDFK